MTQEVGVTIYVKAQIDEQEVDARTEELLTLAQEMLDDDESITYVSIDVKSNGRNSFVKAQR